jgi:cobalt-zinc-cadmium efflux system outer membrane protein
MRFDRTLIAIWHAGLLVGVCLFGSTRVMGSGQVDTKRGPAAQAAATSAPLTLADLEQLALQHNPTLTQAALQVEAARAKALQAGLYPNPTIGYAAELIGADGTAGEFQGGFVQQTIVTAGKLRLSQAKYNQAAVEAELMTVVQQLRVLNGIRRGFYELLAAQRMIEMRTAMLKNAREEQLTRREMLNTGLANEAEVLQAEIEVDRAKLSLQEQHNKYLALWEKVTALAGVPGTPPRALQGRLEPDDHAPALRWESSLDRLLAESPELQAARAHILHDELTLKREKAEPIPDLQVKTGAGYDFTTRNSVANFEVGVKLPLWNRNQGTICQAQADLARSHGEVERLELSLRQRLAEAFEKYQTALAKANLYRDSSMPKASRAYEIMLDQYKKKRAEWIKVVEFQHRLLEVQGEYTTALLELRRAEVSIQGLLLEDGLSVPPAPRPGGHLDVSPNPR